MQPFIKQIHQVQEYRSVIAYLSWIAAVGRVGDYYKIELYIGWLGSPILLYNRTTKPKFRNLTIIQIFWLVPYLLIQTIGAVGVFLWALFLFYTECLFKESFIGQDDYITRISGYIMLVFSLIGMISVALFCLK